MKLIFSENNGEYLNKRSEKSIESSNLKQIDEAAENVNEANLTDKKIT